MTFTIRKLKNADSKCIFNFCPLDQVFEKNKVKVWKNFRLLPFWNLKQCLQIFFVEIFECQKGNNFIFFRTLTLFFSDTRPRGQKLYIYLESAFFSAFSFNYIGHVPQLQIDYMTFPSKILLFLLCNDKRSFLKQASSSNISIFLFTGNLPSDHFLSIFFSFQTLLPLLISLLIIFLFTTVQNKRCNLFAFQLFSSFLFRSPTIPSQLLPYFFLSLALLLLLLLPATKTTDGYWRGVSRLGFSVCICISLLPCVGGCVCVCVWLLTERGKNGEKNLSSFFSALSCYLCYLSRKYETFRNIATKRGRRELWLMEEW